MECRKVFLADDVYIILEDGEVSKFSMFLMTLYCPLIALPQTLPGEKMELVFSSFAISVSWLLFCLLQVCGSLWPVAASAGSCHS